MKPGRIALPVALAVALLALGLGLAACGEKSENVNGGTATPFKLTLDFYPNPDHAGIYMAQKLGYFKEAGLEVSIETPSDPSTPIKEVAAGRTDLAISYEPEVILAHDQGLDVVAVGALVGRPLTSMIWLKKSGIRGIADLRGKTIATAGIPYQDAYLKTILARAKLTPSDVNPINVGFGLLPAIVSGKAQAMLGGFLNVEGVDLRLRGEDPVVTPVDRLGVPTYDELVFVANRSRLGEEAQSIRLFLAALSRGTKAAIEDPQTAAAALHEANPSLEPKLTEAELRATLPLLSRDGAMNSREWTHFIAWMRDNGLIRSLPAASEVLDDSYLPGKVSE